MEGSSYREGKITVNVRLGNPGEIDIGLSY